VIEIGKHSQRPVAALSLAADVHHMDPEEGMFAAMISGWEGQQRARFLRQATIQQRVSVMRRFAAFADLIQWQWTPADADARSFVNTCHGTCCTRPTTSQRRGDSSGSAHGLRETIRVALNLMQWLTACSTARSPPPGGHTEPSGTGTPTWPSAEPMQRPVPPMKSEHVFE
jgi:hypothetical protein